MTDHELALIRQSIAEGLGLTHERAQRLLAALDEARDLGRELMREWVYDNDLAEYGRDHEYQAYLRRYPWLHSSEAVKESSDG